MQMNAPPKAIGTEGSYARSFAPGIWLYPIQDLCQRIEWLLLCFLHRIARNSGFEQVSNPFCGFRCAERNFGSHG